MRTPTSFTPEAINQQIRLIALAVVAAIAAELPAATAAEARPDGVVAALDDVAEVGSAAADDAVDEAAKPIAEIAPTLLQLAAKFGGDWFATLVDRPVRVSSPVARTVLGTRSRGTALTTGHVAMRQLEAESTELRVTFLLTLTARTVSNTVGTNGPVRVHSETTIPFTSTVRVWFDGKCFTAGEASFAGEARLRVTAVRSRKGLGSRLFKRIAWGRIDESRPCVEQIALDATRQRVVESYTKSVADHLAHLNQRVAKIDLAAQFREAALPASTPAPLDAQDRSSEQTPTEMTP